MKGPLVSFVILAASMAACLTSAAAVPLAGCSDISTVQSQPVSAVRYVIGLGKREPKKHKNDATTGDADDANGGSVTESSGGGNQKNKNSSKL